MKPRYWLSRLMAASWAAHLPFVTWMAPDSLSGRALAASGAMSHVAMVLVVILSAVAVLDMAVNDAMPDRFQLLTIRYRHVGFLAISILLVMLAFVIVHAGTQLPVITSYLLAAGFSAWVAWLDLAARHQRRRRP